MLDVGFVESSRLSFGDADARLHAGCLETPQSLPPDTVVGILHRRDNAPDSGADVRERGGEVLAMEMQPRQAEMVGVGEATGRLDAAFLEIAWGDRGENKLVLEPLDMVSVPRGENRSFRNVSTELGRLLVMIVPETDEQADPISYAGSLAKEIESEYGRGALEGLRKVGFKFEDEPVAS